MLKTIGLIVVLAIAGILVVALIKPNTFVVERSTTINASPEKVATLINDFHQWNSWSPWVQLDPNMKTTYAGTPSGVGSVYQWEGNSKVGVGRMEIVSVEPGKTIVKLDFLKPFKGHYTSAYLLQPQGSATYVTWVMDGPMTFFPDKLMSVFMPMDKMVGPDFERGLANMKAVAERP